MRSAGLGGLASYLQYYLFLVHRSIKVARPLTNQAIVTDTEDIRFAMVF